MHTGADEYEYRGEPPPELRSEVDTAPDQRDVAAAARRGARARRGRVLAGVAALLLAPVSVPLGFRLADSDGPTPVPQLLAFLPWFLVPGWLALFITVLGRRWFVTLWAVAVLAVTGWFVQPYGSAGPPLKEEPGKARFRVMTANLEYGDATSALLTALRRERPQLVAVQECERTCAAALRTPEMREAYPHRVIADGDGADGSALLSTYPLRSTPPVPGELHMPGAVAEIGGTSVRVQVAHPMPPLPDGLGTWNRELDRLGSYVARGDGPTLLAGDFNATQDHAAFRDILDTGLRDAARLQGKSRTPTWPSLTAPPLGAQIDHVLLSKEFEAVDAQFTDLSGSDHRALLVDLRMY